MLKFTPSSKNASLRSLLLMWIIGSGLLLAIVHIGLSEYYFRFGVTLRTKATFEQNAIAYAQQYQNSGQRLQITGLNLNVYHSFEEIPQELLRLFPVDSHSHQKMQIMGDDDDFNERDAPLDEMKKLCTDALCDIMFFYSYQMDDGSWIYMAQGVAATDAVHKEMDLGERISWSISFILLLIFSSLALLLIRKISFPVQQLAAWAEGLKAENLKQDKPDFQYLELNTVADKLNKAFERVSESVKNEQQFLQHASHELRTPIAVASGNLEILKLLSKERDSSAKEIDSINRLNFAVKDMQQITETLLWLNRDEESLPPARPVNLKLLVADLIADNNYLLDKKAVEVSVQGEDIEVSVQSALCSIVISNLIRNAFQYTRKGSVYITIEDCSINVHNINDSYVGTDSNTDEVYGFGLGLELVSQITNRMGWRYDCLADVKGRSSTVYFTNH